MKDVEDKMAQWAKLYEQCEKLEDELRCAATAESRAAIQAQLDDLKAQAGRALVEATAALHQSNESGKGSAGT